MAFHQAIDVSGESGSIVTPVDAGDTSAHSARRSTWTRTAAAVVVTIVVASQAIELFINRVVRPDLEEWTWISEALLIGALMLITSLWTRLRVAQTIVTDLERQRLTIQTELAVAAKVQRALLPTMPDPIHGVMWYAAMEPAGQVGGDYYDLFQLGDDRVCIVLADVSGKGVPAAVFVSNIRALLRAVTRDVSTPGDVLTKVSEMVLLDGAGTLYVTCFVAIVDARRRTIFYANAGHPPGLILGRSARSLSTGGPPLGLLPATQYDDELVMLEPGDLVVVVSDGITDALDASGDAIPERLRTEIVRSHALTPKAVCAALLSVTRRARGPANVADWADDRTVVAFRVPGPSTPD